MRKGKVVVIGIMAGLAAGAIAGILLAPEKGSTTRKQIRNKGNDYAHTLKSKLDELRDSISERFKSTKKDAENLAEKGKAKYDDAKIDVKNTAANFKHDYTADNMQAK